MDMKEEQEKIDELALYIKMQEEHYSEDNANQYEQLTEKYELKRLALLVAEAKLQFDQGSAEAQIADMWKELAIMQYKLSMGEEKVCLILSMHKAKTRLLVVDFLDKGWKTWSAQVTELQLLWADWENRKNQEVGFFKMDKAPITPV